MASQIYMPIAKLLLPYSKVQTGKRVHLKYKVIIERAFIMLKKANRSVAVGFLYYSIPIIILFFRLSHLYIFREFVHDIFYTFSSLICR